MMIQVAPEAARELSAAWLSGLIGVVGTLVGSAIGGFITYRVTMAQVKRQESRADAIEIQKRASFATLLRSDLIANSEIVKALLMNLRGIQHFHMWAIGLLDDKTDTFDPETLQTLLDYRVKLRVLAKLTGDVDGRAKLSPEDMDALGHQVQRAMDDLERYTRNAERVLTAAGAVKTQWEVDALNLIEHEALEAKRIADEKETELKAARLRHGKHHS